MSNHLEANTTTRVGAVGGVADAGPGSLPVVLHVRVVRGAGGGPDKTILNSPRFLRQLGYQGVCVYLRHPEDEGFSVLEQRAAQHSAPFEAVDDFGITDWRIVARLQEVVHRWRPLIWHGHDYKSNLLGLILRRKYPMQLVSTVHGWVHRTWKTPLYYFVDRQCLRRYDQVACVSEDLFQDCCRIGVAREKLWLIENAIALEDYLLDVSPAEAKARLGLSPETKLVVAVGRLSHEKGFDLLIQAVANLLDAGLDVALVIAGDGSERESLQRLIDETGHRSRISLLGFVADPRQVYRAGDLYVLSSRREGLPNVVLEAMAMELPVLATSVAGIPSLLQEDVNGRLIPPGSLLELQRELERLILDAESRQRLGAAGRKTVEEKFSFDLRMQKIVQIYRASSR